MKFTKSYRGSSEKDEEDWKTILKCLNSIDKKYQVLKSKCPTLKNFNLFSSKKEVKHIDTWEIKSDKNQFKLCLIEYGFEYRTGKSVTKDTHKYFFGYLNISKDYGKTLIRPETIVDKLSEFFSPVEIDFSSNKEFSDKYYCLSSDKENLIKVIEPKLLKFLASISDIQIEFNGKKCLIRLPKAIDFYETELLCKIGLKLDEILNN